MFAAALPAVANAKGGGKVHCTGANDCKGRGGCKSGDHDCKGKNDCKGKGWVSMSEKDCTAKGGTPEPKAEEKK
jgi:hypothetical protein